MILNSWEEYGGLYLREWRVLRRRIHEAARWRVWRGLGSRWIDGGVFLSLKRQRESRSLSFNWQTSVSLKPVATLEKARSTDSLRGNICEGDREWHGNLLGRYGSTSTIISFKLGVAGSGLYAQIVMGAEHIRRDRRCEIASVLIFVRTKS